MRTHNLSLLVCSLIMILVSLACTINIGGPKYPSPSIPISTEVVGELQSTLAAAVTAGVSSGQVTLKINESQLTSFLSYKLQAQSNPILSNIQVYLQDGQIKLYGTAKQGYFEATAGIILTAGVDDQGQLLIDLTTADFGPLPVPAGLLDVTTTAIKEAYTSALGPIATGFRLDSIKIESGTMTVVGRIK
jgi:uncharacterized protein YpmS